MKGAGREKRDVVHNIAIKPKQNSTTTQWCSRLGLNQQPLDLQYNTLNTTPKEPSRKEAERIGTMDKK